MQATRRKKQDYFNGSFCSICLSSDRKLSGLQEYCELYKLICKKIVRVKMNLEVKLCWECLALLRNVKKFQDKVKKSQDILKSDKKILLESLTDLSLTTPTVIDLENFSFNQGVKEEKATFSIDVKQEDTSDDCLEDTSSLFKPEDSNDNINEVIKDEYKNKKELSNSKNTTSLKIAKPIKAKRIYSKKQNFDEPSDENKIDGSLTNKTNRNNFQTNKEDIKQLPEISKKSKRLKITIERSKLYKFLGNRKDNKCNIYKSSKIPFHEVHYWMDFERNSHYFKKTKNKCHICLTNIDSKGFEKHNELHKPSPFKYTCDYCGLSFEFKRNLVLHMREHRVLRTCNTCGYKCMKKLHMYSHARSHGAVATRAVECLTCHDTFINSRVFYEHYRNTHYAVTHLYYCDYCNKKYLHRKTIIKHITRHHMPLVCVDCNLTFNRYKSWKQHRDWKHRIERSESSYCVQCDKQFSNVARYKEHLKQATAHAAERNMKNVVKKMYECASCDKRYSRATTLKYHHTLVHSGQPKFYCAACDKAFLTNARLRTHNKYQHLGVKREKNKICTVCGRGFTTNATLINHMRTHTGERPFECPHCDAKFAQQVAMRSHVRNIHMKISNY